MMLGEFYPLDDIQLSDLQLSRLTGHFLGAAVSAPLESLAEYDEAIAKGKTWPEIEYRKAGCERYSDSHLISMYPELQDKVCHSAVLHGVRQTQGFGNWTSKKKYHVWRDPAATTFRDSRARGLTDSMVERRSAALINSTCCYQCHRDR